MEGKYIEADRIYQDEFIHALSNTPPGESLQVSHLEGKYLAGKLLDRIDSVADYTELLHSAVYQEDEAGKPVRPTLYDSTILGNFLAANGYSIDTLEQCEDTGQTTFGVTKGLTESLRQGADAVSTPHSLPLYTEQFYSPHPQPKSVIDEIDLLPRVLNIGSGHDPAKQLPHAINIDLSTTGRPDIAAAASKLPFRDGHFTVVMASHVLEHFSYSELPEVLAEWLRVLHPKGLLRIAVPDAYTTLNELRDGHTSKRAPSYSIPGGSAPLTQLLGLGAEHSATDARWRHRILFSTALLETILRDAGVTVIEEYDKDEALSHICGADTDELNRYSLRIEALKERKPHQVAPEMSEEDYLSVADSFDWSKLHGIRIVIPVCNEEEELPSFLPQLKDLTNELRRLDISHELRFVINGTTDNSRQGIEAFIQDSAINASIVESAKGIKQALSKGAEGTDSRDFLAKIDVDTTFSYWTLPLLIKNLLDNKDRIVSYAEAFTKEDYPNRFNMAEYYQDFRTERLYYHGRFSLYRSNPFDTFPAELLLGSETHAEDIMFSCLYAYYFGLNAVGPAPGAAVRSSQPSSIDGLIRKFDRSRQEISGVEAVFPQLRILSAVLKRVETTPDAAVSMSDPEKFTMWQAYHSLHKAMTTISRLNDGVTSNADGWQRLR